MCRSWCSRVGSNLLALVEFEFRTDEEEEEEVDDDDDEEEVDIFLAPL